MDLLKCYLEKGGRIYLKFGVLVLAFVNFCLDRRPQGDDPQVVKSLGAHPQRFINMPVDCQYPVHHCRWWSYKRFPWPHLQAWGSADERGNHQNPEAPVHFVLWCGWPISASYFTTSLSLSLYIYNLYNILIYIYTLQFMYHNISCIVDPLVHASPHVSCIQAKDWYVEPSHIPRHEARRNLRTWSTYFGDLRAARKFHTKSMKIGQRGIHICREVGILQQESLYWRHMLLHYVIMYMIYYPFINFPLEADESL